jgi:hypothetical protein
LAPPEQQARAEIDRLLAAADSLDMIAIGSDILPLESRICRIKLFTHGSVAIGGSKFKAVSSGDKDFHARDEAPQLLRAYEAPSLALTTVTLRLASEHQEPGTANEHTDPFPASRLHLEHLQPASRPLHAQRVPEDRLALESHLAQGNPGRCFDEFERYPYGQACAPVRQREDRPEADLDP